VKSYGTRSYAIAEGPHDALVNIENSLQLMNDLDIHPKQSQLLLLNGCTSYHFLFVDCCFNVFILHHFQDITTFEACDLGKSVIFDNEA